MTNNLKNQASWLNIDLWEEGDPKNKCQWHCIKSKWISHTIGSSKKDIEQLTTVCKRKSWSLDIWEECNTLATANATLKQIRESKIQNN